MEEEGGGSARAPGPHSGGMQRCCSAGARRLVVTHTQGFGKRAAPFLSSLLKCLRHRPGSLRRCPPRTLASWPSTPTPTAPRCRPQGSATAAPAPVVGLLRLVGCDKVLQSRFSRCYPLTVPRRDYFEIFAHKWASCPGTRNCRCIPLSHACCKMCLGHRKGSLWARSSRRRTLDKAASRGTLMLTCTRSPRR